MNLRYIKASASSLLLLMVAFVSCTKLVEVNTPPIYTSDENAYTSDETAIAILTGIYVSMSTSTLSRGQSLNSFMSYYGSLSADEFKLYKGVTNANYIAYYRNTLLNTSSPNIWTVTYPFIYRTNAAIEGLTASKTLTESVKNQLLGEAKFLRAFYYFYLVNLYGPVPLPLTSKYTENTKLARAPVDAVYEQVIKDLTAATALLSDVYTGPDAHTTSDERVVPTKWAAKAMLARVYLYKGAYADAVTQSTDVINYTTLFHLTTLHEVFLKNSQEAIWQLQPVNLGWNTEDARLFTVPTTGPSNSYPISLDSEFLSSFESGDQRGIEWVDTIFARGENYIFPYKYKVAKFDAPVTEYQMMLRLAEQYLVRAEANARLNNIGSAIDDLNMIRNRAGLSGYEGEQTQTAVLNAIMHERRVELFSEMGHRWMDLKRTGAVDSVMTAATKRKGGTWQSYQQYYPISNTELEADPNLAQNSGY